MLIHKHCVKTKTSSRQIDIIAESKGVPGNKSIPTVS